jgi:hypothetical protein
MQVEAFLRGPERRSQLFYPFSRLPDARRWAQQHFGPSHAGASAGSSAFTPLSTYSATATTSGRVAEAFCFLEKTDAWFMDQHSAQRKEVLRKELSWAQQLRRVGP